MHFSKKSQIVVRLDHRLSEYPLLSTNRGHEYGWPIRHLTDLLTHFQAVIREKGNVQKYQMRTPVADKFKRHFSRANGFGEKSPGSHCLSEAISEWISWPYQQDPLLGHSSSPWGITG